jgi:hypothetical protein
MALEVQHELVISLALICKYRNSGPTRSCHASESAQNSECRAVAKALYIDVRQVFAYPTYTGIFRQAPSSVTCGELWRCLTVGSVGDKKRLRRAVDYLTHAVARVELHVISQLRRSPQ